MYEKSPSFSHRSQNFKVCKGKLFCYCVNLIWQTELPYCRKEDSKYYSSNHSFFHALLPLVFVFQYIILFGEKHQFLTDDNNLGRNDKKTDLTHFHMPDPTIAILLNPAVFYHENFLLSSILRTLFPIISEPVTPI